MGLHCGVDIVETDRLEKSFSLKGDIFRNKVFTEKEIEYCEAKKAGKYQSYAARFAAKEAVSKALGTGISGGIGLKDIEVSKGANGRPGVLLSGKAKAVFEEMQGTDISLSLSHCKSYAVAYCIILTK